MQATVKIHPLAWNIIIGTLFARLATSMSMPFLAIYLTMTKGVSPSVTGAIIGISMLVGVFASFIGGSLSDKYGREKIMVGSIIVWTLVFIGFAFADNIVAFFLLNAGNGICRAFFEPTSRALLSDLTKPENRLMIFNLRYGAINAGVAIGPIVGLQLGTSSSTTPFLVAAAVYILYMASLLIQFRHYEFVKTPKDQHVTMKQSLHIIRKDRVLFLTIIGLIACNVVYSQFSSNLSQYFANSGVFYDGVKIFSYALTINAVSVIVFQYPVTRIGKKYSALVSIMIGTLIVSVGLFCIGLSKTEWMVYACTILFTVGEVLMFSMTDLFIDQISPSYAKGSYFGAMGFTGFGSVIGPWLGGILLEHYGYQNGGFVFSLVAILGFISFPILLLVNILLKRRTKQIQSMLLHINK
ncbi:MDR family MFS transporter [Ectobacillus sp. sgz5001026]|uniref:MDR family MFS transporter n=1 Tax=Ectobacillus sp. sgz5001026 TaxID=3242473 RepID=UPI0036D3E57B